MMMTCKLQQTLKFLVLLSAEKNHLCGKFCKVILAKGFKDPFKVLSTQSQCFHDNLFYLDIYFKLDNVKALYTQSQCFHDVLFLFGHVFKARPFSMIILLIAINKHVSIRIQN